MIALMNGSPLPQPGFSVLKNTSDATAISFNPEINFNSVDVPSDFSVADIIDDGKADVVLTKFNSNSVSIFINTSTPGNISFAEEMVYPTAIRPCSVSTGDLNL